MRKSLIRGITSTLAVLGIAALAFAGTGGQLTGGGTGLKQVVLSGSAGQLAIGSGITPNPLLVTWTHDSTLQGTGSAGSAAGVVPSQLLGRFLGRQILTGSGTYVPTSGTTVDRVRMVGGGGGGGGATSNGANVSSASGGSSGVMLEVVLGTPGTTLTGGAYAGGAGGAGGTSTSSTFTNGSSGGDTTIIINSTTYTAKGGGGGKGFNAVSLGQTVVAGGAPLAGTTAVGFITYNSGGVGMELDGELCIGGAGGSTPLGAGGAAVEAIANGNPGQGLGGGGAGAASCFANRNGGNGAAGGIVIDEYK